MGRHANDKKDNRVAPGLVVIALAVVLALFIWTLVWNWIPLLVVGIFLTVAWVVVLVPWARVGRVKVGRRQTL